VQGKSRPKKEEEEQSDDKKKLDSLQFELLEKTTKSKKGL